MNQQTFYRLFFGLIALAVLITFFSLFLTAGNFLLEHNPKAMDFVAFYTGAKLLLQNPHHLYDLNAQQFFQQQMLPVTKAQHIFLPFLNPPFVAVLFTPFVFVNLPIAYDLWLLINVVMLFVICFWIWKQMATQHQFIRILSIVCIMTFLPVLTSLMVGQLSILLCFVLFCSWKLLQEKKFFLSGLCLSLFLIKPHFLLIPFLAFLIQRNKPVLRGLFAGGLFLVIISFLFVGEDAIKQYVFLLANATSWTSTYQIDLLAQHSIQTVLLFFFHTTDVTVIRPVWYAFCAIVIIPVVLIWRVKYATDSTQTTFQWSLLLIVTLLTSSHTHFHDLTLLLLLPYLLLRVSKNVSIILFSGYLLQLIGFVLETFTKKHSDPIWITFSVLYLIILSYYLFRQFLFQKLKKK